MSKDLKITLWLVIAVFILSILTAGVGTWVS